MQNLDSNLEAELVRKSAAHRTTCATTKPPSWVNLRGSHVRPPASTVISLEVGDWRLYGPGFPNATVEALVIIGLMCAQPTVEGLSVTQLAHSIAVAAQDRIYRWRPETTPDYCEELLSPDRLQDLAASLGSIAPRSLNLRWQPSVPDKHPSTSRSGHTDHLGNVGHTSHFAAVDAAGNTACATQTLGGLFGSGLWVKGMPVNGLGAYLYSGAEDAPPGCAPAPGRPPASILEMIIAERKRPQGTQAWFTMGSPGGFVIPGAVAQGALTMMEHFESATGMIDAARKVLATARIAVGDRGAVTVERRVPEGVRSEMVTAGFDVHPAADWAWIMGCLNHVATDGRSMVAGADPRRGSSALAT